MEKFWSGIRFRYPGSATKVVNDVPHTGIGFRWLPLRSGSGLSERFPYPVLVWHNRILTFID
jgi:hypothetical protein